MSKVHTLIKDAAAYIDGEEIAGRSLAAIALLMQAELELKLEERAERRHGSSVALAMRLAMTLPILGMDDVVIVPTPDGLGFVIGVANGDRQEHQEQILRVWKATGPFRAAGWKFSFSFREKFCADGHGYLADMPFCVACGHVPEDNQ